MIYYPHILIVLFAK